MQLYFENGNWMSTVWGIATYSDNHDVFRREGGVLDAGIAESSTLGVWFKEPMKSTTVEVMYSCGEDAQKKIDAAFPDEGNPIGYMAFDDWLKLLNILRKEKAAKPSTD